MLWTTAGRRGEEHGSLEQVDAVSSALDINRLFDLAAESVILKLTTNIIRNL